MLDSKLYKEWYRRWCQPIVDALYERDHAVGWVALEQARATLEDEGLIPERREVRRYMLLWFEYHLLCQQLGDQAGPPAFAPILSSFSTPAATPPGERQRRRLLVTLYCLEDAAGRRPATRRELTRLLAFLPGSDSDSTLWHHVATWAFQHDDLPLMEQAYVVLSTQPNPALGQAKWLRANLMYRLMRGKATHRDVLETVQGLEVLPQLEDLERLIWPSCVKAGLVDEELEQLFAAKAAQLREQDPKAPGLEPRTKRFRTWLG